MIWRAKTGGNQERKGMTGSILDIENILQQSDIAVFVRFLNTYRFGRALVCYKFHAIVFQRTIA